MMAISLSTGQRILIIVALLMVLWYVIGTWYSRRKGIRTFNWLREGLHLLGEQLQAGWIGSAASGARIAVNKPNPPFRQLETTFLLESRELLPVWVVNLLRGRRDELIIKAHLRSLRQGEIEVAPAGSRLARSLRQEAQSSWRWQEGPHSLYIAHRGRDGEALSVAALPFLRSYGRSVRRFSWRRDRPHVLIQMRLAGLTDFSCSGFVTDLTSVFTQTRQTTEDE